jgi:hypothetical protein
LMRLSNKKSAANVIRIIRKIMEYFKNMLKK